MVIQHTRPFFLFFLWSQIGIGCGAPSDASPGVKLGSEAPENLQHMFRVCEANVEARLIDAIEVESTADAMGEGPFRLENVAMALGQRLLDDGYIGLLDTNHPQKTPIMPLLAVRWLEATADEDGGAEHVLENAARAQWDQKPLGRVRRTGAIDNAAALIADYVLSIIRSPVGVMLSLDVARSSDTGSSAALDLELGYESWVAFNTDVARWVPRVDAGVRYRISGDLRKIDCDLVRASALHGVPVIAETLSKEISGQPGGKALTYFSAAVGKQDVLKEADRVQLARGLGIEAVPDEVKTNIGVPHNETGAADKASMHWWLDDGSILRAEYEFRFDEPENGLLLLQSARLLEWMWCDTSTLGSGRCLGDTVVRTIDAGWLH